MIEDRMKKTLCLLFSLFILMLGAKEISFQRASNLAQNIIQNNALCCQISDTEVLSAQNQALAYVYHLEPRGYLVVSAQEQLTPLMAYSLDADFHGENNLLQDLLIADLSQRYAYQDVRNIQAWQNIENNPPLLRNDYLLSSNWNQTYPWNALCPMDPVSNSRSIAGCPAIAMGQIVNYLQALNGTRLNDTDDYYHSYSGRNYMIDDDYETLDFPSFPRLNTYLDQINQAFKYQIELSDTLEAALVFACGTALTQVYSSQASGTFAVDQAFEAYQRFGFDHAALLGPEASDLFSRMQDNLAEGIPVHLAVVTPAWDAGHNVVVDGYSEEMYHLNFGWGGQYNGWYNLPDGIPYGLTVVEGAVVDLQPRDYIFCMPDSIVLQTGGSQLIEIINLRDSQQDLMDIRFGEGLVPEEWMLSISLPASLPPLGMLTITLSHLVPVRETIESEIRLIFQDTACTIPIVFEDSSAGDDPSQSPMVTTLNVYPNPFSDLCRFEASSKLKDARLQVYNLRGQLVFSSSELEWNGHDRSGRECPSGIYLYRVESSGFSRAGKLLKTR